MVSDVIPVQSMHQTTTSNTIMLTCLLGNELRLVLWGDRAIEFEVEEVRAMGAKEPVIAIFVGTLPKITRGVKGLSSSSACRWYVDEDISDINSFRASLGKQVTPTAAYVPTGAEALMARVQEDPVDKTVKELTELDPFVDMEKMFFCTVTLTRLGPDQRWWFSSCSTCCKSARLTGYQYRCSDDACTSVDADLTYCVSVFASDSTSEAEFVLFDKVAAGAVGKPLMVLLRQRYPGRATIEELASAARNDSSIPPEITRLIGQKYKLLVCISKKWKVKNTKDLSFQINKITETYKPELPPPVFGVASGSGGQSSSGSGTGPQLPPLGPIISPVAHTPTALVKAPCTPIANLSPSTPAKQSSAHRLGAKRALFTSPSKNKPQLAVEAAISPPATHTMVDYDKAAVKDSEKDVVPPRTADTVVDKDREMEIASLKTKRATGTEKKLKN